MIKPEIKLHVNGIVYVLVGDSYMPDSVFVHEQRYIGYYGHKRLEFLCEHDVQQFNRLNQSNALINHLIQVNQSAISAKEKMLSSLFNEKIVCSELSENTWLKYREHLLRLELSILCNIIYN